MNYGGKICVPDLYQQQLKYNHKGFFLLSTLEEVKDLQIN